MEWPYTATGKPSTKDKTFRNFSFVPEVESLRQIRSVVEQLRKPSFTVKDGRNYFSILPFKAESSRNTTIGCLFQAPSWLRGLIQPAPGRGLIYCDWSQQKYFIAGWQFLNAARLLAFPFRIGMAVAVGFVFGDKRLFACLCRHAVGKADVVEDCFVL
jgi:hypothetical protein